MKLYGIPNCNTVKKARDWLTQHDIAVEFCNFKKDGVDEAPANRWLQQVGWESIINRKGLTWRGLDDQTKQNICDNPSALELMQEKSSVIKRPILEKNGKILHVGFDESSYSKIFNL
ncbi:MAG: arsenate reductase [Gallionella sp.]